MKMCYQSWLCLFWNEQTITQAMKCCCQRVGAGRYENELITIITNTSWRELILNCFNATFFLLFLSVRTKFCNFNYGLDTNKTSKLLFKFNQLCPPRILFIVGYNDCILDILGCSLSCNSFVPRTIGLLFPAGTPVKTRIVLKWNSIKCTGCIKKNDTLLK